MLEKEEIVSPNLEELKSHYRSIITLLGEDAEREGLLKTPERVAKAMLSLTKGLWIDCHWHSSYSRRVLANCFLHHYQYLLCSILAEFSYFVFTSFSSGSDFCIGIGGCLVVL